MQSAQWLKQRKPFAYSGVGSRRAPRSILEEMRDLADYVGSLGYILRTGGADGSDINFEVGALAGGYPVELWLPWKNYKFREGVGFFPEELHKSIARTVHPIFDKLPNYMQYLHARNVGQVLGKDCNDPSKFLVCWTPDGCEGAATRSKATGGTGTAIVLAEQSGVPVFNIKNSDAIDRLMEFLSTHLNYPSRCNEFYDDKKDMVLPEGIIFTFGSNLKGIHGKGAALAAKNFYGAVQFQGEGLQGNSYAVPTKDENIQILPLERIKIHVDRFVEFTKTSGLFFYVTPVGCGLAGYKPEQIAPLFRGVQNCWLPLTWLPYVL